MTTAVRLKSGRQGVIWAYLDVVLANHATTVALDEIEVPQGAIVVGGFVSVTEVFDSTSSDVLDIGDSGTANRYKNDINLQSLGYTALVPTGYVYTAPSKIKGTWVSGGGTPTTGAYTLAVAYIVRGRADLGSQGADT